MMGCGQEGGVTFYVKIYIQSREVSDRFQHSTCRGFLYLLRVIKIIVCSVYRMPGQACGQRSTLCSQAAAGPPMEASAVLAASSHTHMLCIAAAPSCCVLATGRTITLPPSLSRWACLCPSSPPRSPSRAQARSTLGTSRRWWRR